METKITVRGKDIPVRIERVTKVISDTDKDYYSIRTNLDHKEVTNA